MSDMSHFIFAQHLFPIMSQCRLFHSWVLSDNPFNCLHKINYLLAMLHAQNWEMRKHRDTISLCSDKSHYNYFWNYDKKILI